MSQLFQKIISDITWQNLIDILMAAALIYYFIIWLQGTRAMQLVRGFFVLFIFYLFSRFFGFKTIDWLLTQFGPIFLVLLVIVFQPELRRALEKMGRGRFLQYLFPARHSLDLAFVRKISAAVNVISHKRWGALLVLEKTPGLTADYLESGTRLEAILSPELLISIFNPLSPLHDGAVIIQNHLVLGAHCLLPLTENPAVDKGLGTRHRAAIGITELTDALAIIVSEQTGIISLVENGQITRYLNQEMLADRLLEVFSGSTKIKKEAAHA